MPINDFPNRKYSAMSDDITRRLQQEALQELSKLARNDPEPVNPEVLRRQRIGEIERLTSEVLAKLKALNSTRGWELIWVGPRKKLRQVAGYPVVRGKTRWDEADFPYTVYILETGRYVHSGWGEIKKVSELYDRSLDTELIKGLKEIINGKDSS
jgi:hypothetical protein